LTAAATARKLSDKIGVVPQGARSHADRENDKLLYYLDGVHGAGCARNQTRDH